MSLTSISRDIGKSSVGHDELGALHARFETKLSDMLALNATVPDKLRSAMDYALMAPSKRMRPVLLYLINEPSETEAETALRAGSAVEMVHTASLILDDLPSMDDAKIRRDRVTTHMKFGEATAILSAIALLTRGFGILAELDVPSETRTRLASVLATAVGHTGLVAGQEIDLNNRDSLVGMAEIENLNWLKTGTLFVAAAEMGGILRGLSDSRIEAVRRFAKHLGLAFQTADDLLDKTGTAESIGKDVDKDGDKATLVSLFGASKARLTCTEHLEAADTALLESGVTPAPIQAIVSKYLKTKIGVA